MNFRLWVGILTAWSVDSSNPTLVYSNFRIEMTGLAEIIREGLVAARSNPSSSPICSLVVSESIRRYLQEIEPTESQADLVSLISHCSETEVIAVRNILAAQIYLEHTAHLKELIVKNEEFIRFYVGKIEEAATPALVEFRDALRDKRDACVQDIARMTDAYRSL